MVYFLGFSDKSHECLLHPSALSTVIFYAEGFARNLHRTPARIQSLMIRSKKLSAVDEFLLRGLSIITKLSMMTKKMRLMIFTCDVDDISQQTSKSVFSLKRLLSSSTFYNSSAYSSDNHHF